MVTTEADDYPAEIPPEPEFPRGEQPLHEYLRDQAAETPDRVAINYYGREITYGELDESVDRFATYLHELGYEKGDTLLLYLQNCPQYFIGYHAAHRLGMAVSPCSPMSKEHRLEYQLDDGDVEVVLAHDTFADTIAAVADETDITDVVYARFDEYLPDDPVPAIHEDMAAAIAADRLDTGGDAVYFTDALEETDPEPPSVDHHMDDVILLQYTSGTTGMPKGCEHTYWTVLHKAAATATIYGFDAETSHLAVMPVFHVAGKLNAVDAPVVDGGTVVLLTRFETEPLMHAAGAHRPTTAWLTTPMVRGVLNHPDRDEYDLTSFEEIPATSFGQSLTDELCERWKSVTGCEMYEAAYGLSETHTMDTFTRGLGVVEEDFMGRPAYNVDIVVRDWDTHEEVPRGELGEISVESPSVMKGYHNKPEKTEQTMHDGYVLTGDIGKMTEEGYLYFLGRRKNMIKYSGYSISPAEVETILKEHDGIDNAVVVGRDHESKGEEVVATITLADESLTADDVIEWSKENMASYKRPCDVVIVDELPTTDVGKLDRQSIEERVDG
ncbi:AMP-binding protein [Natrinema marinum]|uniref:AMP-binding protein n=1 Tax=Natrinema marinum TaxID=2961598 RepID=UPI0020C90D20|nr:AMP-binding protein [Natrinema marinum]